jgi:bacteriocin-like protein
MTIITTPDQLTDSELAAVSGGAGSASGIIALIQASTIQAS